jgi:hypothetical protein
MKFKLTLLLVLFAFAFTLAQSDYFKKKLKADIIESDKGNGDGVFRARIKKTKLWGMYQGYGNTLIELIPAEFDSLHFIPFNGNFSAVYKKGKVGFYLSHWTYDDMAKQSVPCVYDDYQRFNYDGDKYLAVKKGDFWGWVDWLTGEEKSEFKYASKEDLPAPSFKQDYWAE